jgi:hypothetical protein
MGLLDNIDFNDPKTMGLLNMGLGILAGNTGRPGDLGQGLMGGMQNYQQMMQAQQRQKMLQQQQEMQTQEFGMEKEKFGFEKTKYQQEQDAINRAVSANPAMADMFRVDPKAAFKALYPQANGVDPFFTPIPTEQGIGSFDNRSGKFQIIAGPDGRPVVKSTDSPMVRGNVAGAEAWAKAGAKPTDMEEGVIQTEAQLAARAGGMPGFSTPYPVTWGAPGTTATDQHEGTMTDASVAVLPPSRGRPGIRVPTAAEKAADKVTAEGTAKKEANISGIGSIIDEAKTILTGPTAPTHSSFGNVVDAVGASFGVSPDGAAEADKLKAIGGALVAKMPRMEGPQSNFDVENYQRMAGDVGNPSLPLKRRISALQAVEKLWRKYDKAESTQPATPATARTAVKTGTYKGRKVIQYSDGSVDYAN